VFIVTGRGNIMQKLLLSIFLSLAFMLYFPVGKEGRSADDLPYPAIGDKEMGQLRWILNLADQPLMDFSNMDAKDQRGLSAYRHQIASSASFPALYQDHKLPA